MEVQNIPLRTLQVNSPVVLRLPHARPGSRLASGPLGRGAKAGKRRKVNPGCLARKPMLMLRMAKAS